MTDENTQSEPETLVSPPTVAVSDIEALMAAVRHDVVGQCWQLWTGLEALVKAAA